MYAMGLFGLLLAGLVALGAALGLFSAGPDVAGQMTGERYAQSRAVVTRAVQDGARRSPALGLGTPVLAGVDTPVCAAPWTAQTDCTIPLDASGILAFAPEGWKPPRQSDASAHRDLRWKARLYQGKLVIYGPANASEMAGIQTAMRGVTGLAWCPKGSTDATTCTPQLMIALPADIFSAETATAIAVTQVDLPAGP